RDVQPRLVDGGLQRSDGRPRRALRGAGVVELLLAERLLSREGLVARDVVLRLGEAGPGLLEVRFGLGERGVRMPRVDLEEELASPDEAPLLVDAAQEIAFDLRPDLGVDLARGRPDPLAIDRLVPLERGGDEHLRGRRGLRSRLLPARARGEENGRRE